MLFTIDVLKLDKSRLTKDEHPENKQHMIFTFDVSKLDRSKLGKDEQP